MSRISPLFIRCVAYGCGRAAAPKHAICRRHMAMEAAIAVLALLFTGAALAWFLARFTR